MGVVRSTISPSLSFQLARILLLQFFVVGVVKVGSFLVRPSSGLQHIRPARAKNFLPPTLYYDVPLRRVGSSLIDDDGAPCIMNHQSATRGWRTIPPPPLPPREATTTTTLLSPSAIALLTPPSNEPVTSTTATAVVQQRPPSLDFAKQFLRLSQKRLESILVHGIDVPTNNNSSSTRDNNNNNNNNNNYMNPSSSIQEMYNATKTIRAALQNKEQMFRDVVSRQQHEYVKAQQQFVAWQQYYNQTMEQYQAQLQKHEQQVQQQAQLHEIQMIDVQTHTKQQETSLTEQIRWLTNQLQHIKLESHKKQVEMAQKAQLEHNQLQQRIVVLESQLQDQIEQTSNVTAKFAQQCAKQQELEQQVVQIKDEYQRIMQRLETQLAAEQTARQQEQQQGQQQLALERSQAQREKQLAQQELQQHKTAFETKIKTKEQEWNKTIQELQFNSQSTQLQLTNKVESIRSEMQRLHEFQQRLELEKSAALETQARLLKQIEQQRQAITKLEMTSSDDRKRINELQQDKLHLEEQFRNLTTKFNADVASWESKYRSLQEELTKQQRDYETRLANERNQGKLQLDDAHRHVEAVKRDFDTVLREKQFQFNRALQELHDVSIQTENDLKANLQALSDALQQHKDESQRKLLKLKEDALAKENELYSIIKQKDKVINETTINIQRESARASENWQLRMELERALSTLKAEYHTQGRSWQQKYTQLEEMTSKEHQSLSQRLVQQESHALQQLKLVQAALDELDAKLDKARRTNDASLETRLREVAYAFQTKEKTLGQTVERLANELQQVKLDSHRKHLEEKEASKKQHDALLGQITEKEQQLEAMKDAFKMESGRANEFLRKRLEIEKQLSLVNRDYESALQAWEETAKSFEEARRKEQDAAVSLLAKKETEMNQTVASALHEAQVHKLALESGLKARERQFAFEMQGVREASRQKERELCQRVESLTQQLQDLKLDTHKVRMAEREAADKTQKELLAAVAEKDRELDLQQQKLDQHKRETEQLDQQQLELHREISNLRLQHARAAAASEARYQALVQDRVRDQREAAQRLARLEQDAQDKVEAAVSTAQQYEIMLASSLDNMTRLESHLQSEISKLQRMVHDYCDNRTPSEHFAIRGM